MKKMLKKEKRKNENGKKKRNSSRGKHGRPAIRRSIGPLGSA
jgi:hypothetical protein